MENKAIYMDNAATTKVDEAVLNVVTQNLKETGNPSSTHTLGKNAAKKIEEAREHIAKHISSEKEEIVFTSGATESNNTALLGLAKANPHKKHIITSVIEHPSILATCETLEKEGYIVDYIGVDSDGVVDSSDIEKKIRADTLVVSIMHVNNEIGSIQPISEIGTICKQKEVYFHTDCVQSCNKIPINVKEMNIDLLSISGHKMHAPKGTGALYIKLGTRFKPLLNGGEQEFNLRSGTENVSGVVGLSKCLDITWDSEHIEKVKETLLSGLLEVEGSRVNGSREKGIYTILNMSFSGVDSGALVKFLSDDNIFVSSGSACSTKKLEESHVLSAIGVSAEFIHGSLRFSFSNELAIEDAVRVVESVKRNIADLRGMSPFQ